MKREQAFSMTLKGFEQKRARLLAALGLEDVSLRELPSRCPPEHREAARRMSERLINQYRILSSAQEPSRILMESRLRLIEEELQRRGLEEEGPSTASRTGSDTHTDLESEEADHEQYIWFLQYSPSRHLCRPKGAGRDWKQYHQHQYSGIYPPAAGSGQPDHLRLGPVLFPL